MSGRRPRVDGPTALAFAGGAVLALAVWFGWPRPDPEVAPAPPAVAPAAPAVNVPVARKSPPPSPPPAPSAPSAGLAPGGVIGNPDCKLLPGRGPAADAALVVVPGTSGSRFAVLDGDGEVFGDTLPFVPHHFRLGKRTDGTIVAGVGDLRLNSRVFREPNTPEPVRIYQDGRSIYETEKAWDFGVASDGSSFYVQEPLAGDGSRLVVGNLDAGTVAHIDLGTAYSGNHPFDRAYSVAYANGTNEIMFYKGGDYGRGLYSFHSVADGGVRTVRVGRTFASIADVVPDIVVEDDAFMASIVSSEEGYFAYALAKRAGTGTPVPWRIVRRRFGYGDEPEAIREWTLDIEISGYGGTMLPSDDGRWLGLEGWDFVLLDAATGEAVFEYPKVDKKAEFARLSTVLPDGATLADVGGVTAAIFRDGHLMFYRQIGTASKRSCSLRGDSPGGGLERYYDCMADLRRRGLYRTVLDVFDLDRLEPDGKPLFRVDYDERDQCATGDFPLRGLQVRDGRLTFLATRR